jgi:hypothetical protein
MKDVFMDIYKYPDTAHRFHNIDAIAEFESSIADFGSTIQIEEFEEKNQDLFHYLKWFRGRVLTVLDFLSKSSIFQSQVLNKLNVHIIRNYTLNAVAITGIKYDHIGITFGSFLNINTLFEILLSHPKTFIEIGNSSQEVIKLEDLSSICWTSDYDNILRYLKNHHPTPDKLAPVNIQRKAVTQMLATIALDFLILHELCHILFGHTTLKGKKNAAYYELGRTYSSLSAYEKSQAFELHADGHAIDLLIDILINTDRVPSEEWDHKLFESKEEALYLMFLSVNFIFLILDQNNTSIIDTARHTHPHILVRLINVFGVIRQLGNDRFEPEIVYECWKRAIYSMGEACSILKIPSAISDEISQAYNRLNYLQEVLEKAAPELEFRIRTQ